MGFFKWFAKLLIAAALDTADFFIGRVPGFGTFWDIGLGAVGLVLWGPVGGLQFGELLDFTDQIDGFIPTLTISGILHMGEIWED